MTSEEFRLRRITEPDLPLILRWRNSERIRHNMFTDHVITWQEHWEWFGRLPDNPAQIALVLTQGENPLGLVQFQQIDRIHRRCHWGFYLGAESRPTGSGNAMGSLSIKYAFGELGLQKICGEVLAFNRASQEYFRRLGFVKEGVLRRHVWKTDGFVDVVIFGLLAEEWRQDDDGMPSQGMG